MAKYGITYQGSKGAIAEDIITYLPFGERFVDLFGGGFSMSHCALVSGKYEKVLYNELNPLLCDLIQKGISGYYSYKNFTPKWITREEFNEKKDKDGYIKYIWSFGTKGDSYMFGKDIEENKKNAFNFVVSGDEQALKYLEKQVEHSFYWLIRRCYIPGNITKTRLIYKNIIGKLIIIEKLYGTPKYDKVYNKYKNYSLKQLYDVSFGKINVQLQSLQSLESLERLQSLQSLESLERLEITNKDYRDYEYQEGDIVYLDPPYEGTIGYGEDFNHKEFYDWVASRPYKVYFSSYGINDTRFKKLIGFKKNKIMKAGGSDGVAIEMLYSN